MVCYLLFLLRQGHWVHADNPAGLFEIMAPSFAGGRKLREQMEAIRDVVR
jgi:hypothetical protein